MRTDPGGSGAVAPDAESAEQLIRSAQDAERGGCRVHARALYEAALRRLEPAADPILAINLARWIGRTYAGDGDLEAAMDCAELSLAIAETSRSIHGTAHGLNLVGTLLQQQGDLAAAVEHYERARQHAEQIGESHLVALIEQNLGVVANIQGNFAGAIRHYHASLHGHRASNMVEHVGSVLNNLGMVFTDLQSWDQAEQAYRQALETCRDSGDVSTQIMVEVNRVDMWIARGMLPEAHRACETVRGLIERTGDNRALGELHKFYGVIFRDTGQRRLAETHLARAAMIAEARNDTLLAAETAREQAELFRNLKQNQQTLQSLNRAHSLFSRLQARHDLLNIAGKLRSLEQAFLEIVEQWGDSIESADKYTQGHCVRVADYACALAQRAGMDEKNLLWFRMGALLHDVGKIVVPADLLNKPGALSPEERAVIERHPDAGVALLADIEFPWDIRPMVRWHHERWCGGGYPTGISGEDIPVAARILCIADVFDALTSERPYRAAMDPEHSLSLMRGPMASHFDPSLLALWAELCGRRSAGGGATPRARRVSPHDLQPGEAQAEPRPVHA